MAGKKESIKEAARARDDDSGYERSTIAFPYFDLTESIKVAQAISNNAGGNDCTDDQVAKWMDLSPKSSGYRSRVSAARLFGLLEDGHEEGHRLSELGLRVLDTNYARAAKVEAFLNVPLFKRVYESWRGQQIPPTAALERAMVTFGVAGKQTARARQTLERSATEANFYEHGRDRLVKPGIKSGAPAKDDHQPPPGGGGGAGGGGGGENMPPLDPIIVGLLRRLPDPGTAWPSQSRKRWLGVLEDSLGLIYKDDGDDGGTEGE